VAHPLTGGDLTSGRRVYLTLEVVVASVVRIKEMMKEEEEMMQRMAEKERSSE
jgi:hypothetical protein